MMGRDVEYPANLRRGTREANVGRISTSFGKVSEVEDDSSVEHNKHAYNSQLFILAEGENDLEVGETRIQKITLDDVVHRTRRQTFGGTLQENPVRTGQTGGSTRSMHQEGTAATKGDSGGDETRGIRRSSSSVNLCLGDIFQNGRSGELYQGTGKRAEHDAAKRHDCMEDKRSFVTRRTNEDCCAENLKTTTIEKGHRGNQTTADEKRLQRSQFEEGIAPASVNDQSQNIVEQSQGTSAPQIRENNERVLGQRGNTKHEKHIEIGMSFDGVLAACQKCWDEMQKKVRVEKALEDEDDATTMGRQFQKYTEFKKPAVCEYELERISSHSVRTRALLANNYLQVFSDDFTQLPAATKERMPKGAPLRLSKTEFQHLLQSRAARKVSDWKFISPAFKVQKGNKTKSRLVINMKRLNEYMKPKNGSGDLRKPRDMPTQETIDEFIAENTFAVKYDFVSYFYQIDIPGNWREWFCFSTTKGTMQMNKLPMGYSGAPRIAQEITHALLEKTDIDPRRRQYIYDDVLIGGSSKEETAQLGSRFEETLSKYNVEVHQDKSRKIPSQRIDFWGQDIDLENKSACVQAEWLEEARKEIATKMNQPAWSARDMWTIVGTTIWLLKTNGRSMAEMAPMIEICSKIGADIANWDQEVGKPQEFHTCAETIWAAEPGQRRIFRRTNASFEIYSDASNLGAGISITHISGETLEFFAPWNEIQKEWHINDKETWAAMWAMRVASTVKSIMDDQQKMSIFMDNTTALHRMTKGFVKGKPTLNEVMFDTWLGAQSRRQEFMPKFIAGVKNPADKPSRRWNT